MSARFLRFPLLLVAGLCVLAAASARAEMRITEFMYDATDGEFVEFTNVGSAPVDMTGWSFDDNHAVPGFFSLSAYGVVQPGESVILTEVSAEAFRSAWSLCDGVKIVGGNTSHNLGRSDQINLYDAGGALVDRLTYGDQDFPGTIRTTGKSGWVSAAGLGADDIHGWTLASVGDGEGSVASSAGSIGSPGRSTRATVAFDPCRPPLRITEFMYQGATNQNAEFVEFTNVGGAPVDMSGWSYSDSGRTPGAVPLGAFGVVQAGESVILTELAEADFRAWWGLCPGVKIIGGNSTQNLGRSDEINLYDAGNHLVDRLTYNDQATGGGPRTNGTSAWVSADGLGANVPAQWTLSAVGDAEGSHTSSNADIGSPGKSTRATVAFDPCAGGDADAPTIAVDLATTSPYLDLSGTATVSGVIGDPTDPAATTGIGFDFALPGGGDASTLTIAAASNNDAVVDAAGLALSGSGATRQLTITPHGVGYANITISATDAASHVGTFTIRYAASAAPALPDATRFHTGISDASATVALDDDTMIVGDDETNALRLIDRNHSGLPLNAFDFAGDLNLTDPNNPEIDIEASARLDDRLYWTGSFSNSKNFHVRPNRHRVFATDLSGAGADATLAYAGRYDWLLEDFVAWDQNNGHGLGANYLGFAASSAEGQDSKTPAGFNIEGLAIAPDNQTAYFAFRAPQLPTNARHEALIVPVLNFDSLVTGAAPDSRGQGSAQFGAPIFLDLGGRGIRSLDRNAAGQYLITAGAAGDAGPAPNDFRLYAWTGQPGDAPFDLGIDLAALDVNGGAFESIAEVPAELGAATPLQFLFDNGNSVWYADGVAGKDLADARLKKSASLRVSVDVAFPAAQLAAAGGTPQSAVVGAAFAQPLAVQVTDAYGHAVAGVNVGFAVVAAENGAAATLSSASAVTDGEGRASVDATANGVAGSYAVSASIAGVGTATFALANTAGPAASVLASSGTPQSAIVNAAFAAPLVAHVADAYGNPLANVAVAFVAPAQGVSATLDAVTATTDANGDARTSATANAISGSYVVEARIDGVDAPAVFALTNLVDPEEMIFRDGFETAPAR